MAPEAALLPSQITLLPNTDLRVPAWNPRKIVMEGPLRLLADYILRGGRLERILAWQGEGKAPYDVISGQRRLLAYRRAGVERVPVEILDITLEEAKIMASTSNEGEPVHWLDKFENWETLLADYPNWGGLTALASKLGRDKSEVSRAINLMGLLTPKARKMIREHALQNPPENKGNNAIVDSVNNPDGANALPDDTWQLRERVAARLNGLWKGRGLPQAQALAEKAIPLMLSKQMTASQVNQWVIKANGGEPKAPRAVSGSAPNHLSPGKDSNGGTQMASAPSAQGAGFPMASALRPQAERQALRGPIPEEEIGDKAHPSPDLHSQIGTLMAAHTLGKNIPGANLVMGRLFPHVAKLFHGTKGRLMKMGVKNQIMGTIFTLLIFLFVGSALINFAGRLMKGIYRSILYAYLATPEEKASIPSLKSGGSSNSVQPPTTPNSLSSGALAKGDSLLTSNSAQPALIPSPGNPAPPRKPAKIAPKDPTASLSQAGKHRVQAGAALAADFAKVFYGLSYKTFSDWAVGIGRPLYTPYYGQLLLTFFPELKLESMQKRKLDESFELTESAKVVGVDGDSETILVKGTATIQSDLKYSGQLVAEGPVALILHVNHTYPDHPEGRIDQVRELTALDYDWITGTFGAKHLPNGPQARGQDLVAPSQGADGNGGTQGDSFGKQVGDTVKDAVNAVNTAQQGEDAVDKGKKLLGF